MQKEIVKAAIGVCAAAAVCLGAGAVVVARKTRLDIGKLFRVRGSDDAKVWQMTPEEIEASYTANDVCFQDAPIAE